MTLPEAPPPAEATLAAGITADRKHEGEGEARCGSR